MGNPSEEREKVIMSALPESDERRRHGRIRVSGVECSLGPVIDISGSGARVTARRREGLEVGRAIDITITSEVCPPFRVNARATRVKRTSFMRYEICLAFDDVSDDIRNNLTLIARTCRRSSFFS